MENKNGLDGVGILLAEKWVDKDIDMIRVSDGMIVIKWLVQGIIISVISVYTPKCDLNNCLKDHFYDNPSSVKGEENCSHSRRLQWSFWKWWRRPYRQ